MRRILSTAAMLGALTLGACATLGLSGPAGELAGETLRVDAANGQTTVLLFQRDGTVRAAFGESVVTGRWQVVNRNLCFYWTGAPRECWPYTAPFERGRTRALASDRGNTVRVTLQ